MENFYSTAHLMGGLGNQMFQIAHAVCQGLKNNKESVFEPVAYTPMSQSKQTIHYVDNIFKNVKFVDKIFNKKRVSEETWNKPNLSFSWDSNIEFYGYYQSSNNFFGYDEHIKETFGPDNNFITKLKFLYPNFKNQKSTSVHIRRGDYLTINDILPSVDLSYIDYCINLLDDLTDVFYVFSDDINWAKNNIKSPKAVFVDQLQDYEDLWMMSLCENNVISNSTFSWWSAFLNKNENKKVLCPSIWFGPKGFQDYDNIYVDGWIKVNVNYNNGSLVKTKNDTINLIDSTFAHSKIGYCSDYQDSLFFKWKRENFNKNGNDFVVYTDARLGEVTNNHNSIAWLIEPKEIAPYTYDFIVNNNNKFKKVFTHEKSLLDKGENYELLPFGCCWIKPEDQKIYNKSKMISIISSNKTQTNGHRLRHDIINQLNGKIDVYGRTYNPIDYKLDGLKEYKFHIVVENTKRDYWFTEKLIDCFVTGTVPIYWGCPSIGDFFDTNGMIIFDNIEELVDIINNLSINDYIERIEGIKNNFNLSKKYLLPDDIIYKKLTQQK
jgi:hypothetical protein